MDENRPELTEAEAAELRERLQTARAILNRASSLKPDFFAREVRVNAPPGVFRTADALRLASAAIQQPAPPTPVVPETMPPQAPAPRVTLVPPGAAEPVESAPASPLPATAQAQLLRSPLGIASALTGTELDRLDRRYGRGFAQQLLNLGAVSQPGAGGAMAPPAVGPMAVIPATTPGAGSQAGSPPPASPPPATLLGKIVPAVPPGSAAPVTRLAPPNLPHMPKVSRPSLPTMLAPPMVRLIQPSAAAAVGGGTGQSLPSAGAAPPSGIPGAPGAAPLQPTPRAGGIFAWLNRLMGPGIPAMPHDWLGSLLGSGSGHAGIGAGNRVEELLEDLISAVNELREEMRGSRHGAHDSHQSKSPINMPAYMETTPRGFQYPLVTPSPRTVPPLARHATRGPGGHDA